MPKVKKLFFATLLITLLIKVAVAVLLPMTGDEAYFIVWGNHPDYGYYDHPPMVGWFLTALLYFGDSELWLRMPAIAITTLIGWGIYRIIRDNDITLACLAGILYLTAPINVVGVLITTDTPLIFFSFLSALCFYKAQRYDDISWYAFAGIFLGLAFFSKFFAGLLGLAYVAYTILYVRRGRRPYYGLLWVIAGTLPFIGLNLIWNYNNCWNNYLFNFLNRTQGMQFSVMTTVKYVVILFYLLTPPIFYYLIRQSLVVNDTIKQHRYGVFLGLFIVPIILFAVFSFWKSVGLHWLLSFYPFVFIALASLLRPYQLWRCVYFMVPFSVLHIIALGVIIAFSPGLFRDSENTYKDVTYVVKTNDILNKLKVYGDDYILATDSYTESSLLSYASGKHVMVFGHGSYHARQDEKITDFRTLDGKNILIVSYSQKLKEYANYFKSIDEKPLAIEKTEFYVTLGRGFRYEAYRKDMLKKIIDRYYSIPGFLPVGSCYMYERYAFAR